MTVPVQTPSQTSTGNGVATVYPYNFRILAAADLYVTIAGVGKVLNVDYTLSGVGDLTGGNITFTVAPANGAAVYRARNMDLKRDTDYQTGGDLLAAVVNTDVDRAVMMIQQVSDEINQIIGPVPEGLYLYPGAGAVTRTANAKMADVIGAKDFGAVGDGLTDDTVALNAFLAAATGKFGVIPPGTYKTSATLVLWSNSTIYGYGAEIVPIAASSIPVYQALDDAVDLPGGAALGSRPILSNQAPTAGNSNIRIYGLKWTGNNTGSESMHGLHVNKVTGLTLIDCVTYECLSAIAMLNSTDLLVAHCTIKGFRNGGIDSWAGCKRVRIINNLVDGVAPNSDGSNIGIFCTSEPTDGAVDAATYNAEDYLIAGNVITNIENPAIWVGGGDPTHNRVNDICKRIRVVNNIIRNCGGIGIILERGEDCVIDGNTIVSCGHHGIFTRKNVTAGAAYVDRPTISNNIIRNVGLVTADSKFIHMDDTTRDAHVFGNRGTGTAHTYAMYDRATNSGLRHYGNRFDTGTTGLLTILSADAVFDATDDLGIYRGATVGGTPITLFDAAVQGAVWEVILRTASAGAVAAAYARFIVYGNTTLPSIVAREAAGAVTYTLALSGTNVQATSNIATTTSVYSSRRLA